jgi:hypothetical protein
MSKAEVVARANVIVTVQVSEIGTWGEKAYLEQVHSQAAAAAVNKVCAALRDRLDCRVVGTPQVTSILTDRAGKR